MDSKNYPNSQWAHGSNTVDVDQVVADLLHGSSQKASSSLRKPSKGAPLDSKMVGLSELHRVIVQEKSCTSATFLGHLEDMFRGLRSCLQTQQLAQLSNNSFPGSVSQSQVSNNNQISDHIVDIVLKGNQILFEMMPDIQHSEELEIQMAQLISIFIENLGSPKAIVRKSTHKCIGTYVKLTKKLEFVILHIIHTGLENTNSRTRQHSMLVIPALLSLKSSIIDKEHPEMMNLIMAVVRRIKQDQSEIVSKTGKKLLLELQKCYPAGFKSNYIDKIRDRESFAISQAVLNNDDKQLAQVIQQYASQEPTQQPPNQHSQQQHNDPISVQLSSKETEHNLQDLKHDSRYPCAQNGLLFAFLREDLVLTLAEQEQFQERTLAIEAIELELNKVLASENKKIQFMPYATPFLGFIVQFIKDINFKISLTAINITNKLLAIDLVQVKKHFQQMVTLLIEKLSDSKVIIRQAVLKCCGLLIKSYSPTMFGHQAMKYIQHNNWHVREGILHLVANSLIIQSQTDELKGQQQDESMTIALSPTILQELCSVAKTETKTKIQLMAVDCLALSLDVSQNKQKTDKIIKNELGIFTVEQEYQTNRNSMIYKQIKDRQNPDFLPMMQIDGTIEFRTVIEINQLSALHPQAFQSESQNAQYIHNEMITPKKVDAPAIHQEPVVDVEKQDLKLNQVNRQIGQDSKIQMRFQQERVAQQERINNYSNIDTKQQLQKQQSVDATNIPQSNSNMEDKAYAQNNRQVYSLSTINHSNKKQIYKPEVKTSGEMFKNEIESNMSSPLKSAQPIHPRKFGDGLNQTKLSKDMSGRNQDQDKEKIAMWLPSFQDQGSNNRGDLKPNHSPYGNMTDKKAASENKYTPQQVSRTNINQQIVNTDHKPQGHLKLERLNATASSSATFVDDGRSVKTTTTIISSQINQKLGKQSFSGLNARQQVMSGPDGPSIMKSPVGLGNQGSMMNRKNNQNPSSILSGQMQSFQGYTPQQHQYKPRQIQSNEIGVRQRTLEDASLSQASPSPKHIRMGGGHQTKNEFISIQQSPLLHADSQSQNGQINIHGGRDQKSDMQVMQQRNMSQSSGAPGGFNVNKTLINERLQLLKSTFKYKVNSEQEMIEVKSFENANSEVNAYPVKFSGSASKARSEYNARGLTSQQTAVQTNQNTNNYMGLNAVNPQQTHNSFGLSNVSTNINNQSNNYNIKSAYSANKQAQSTNSTGHNFAMQPHSHQNNNQSRSLASKARPNGPVKASPIQDHEFMQTIQVEENTNKNNNQYTRRTQKPPMGTKNNGPPGANVTTNSAGRIPRAYSVNANESGNNYNMTSKNQNQQDMNPYSQTGMQTATTYNAPEEPLRNPDQQFRQSLDYLRGDDWQKIFDSLNVIKRVSLFHKNLMVSSPQQKECIKAIVKQTDNLRSQVAKNACMTLQTIFSELPQRDLDPSIDIVLSALVKKATDTNQFVSEQAEKALAMVCHACNETKILNCLQSITARSNIMKQKVALCYTNLISKLGLKIKNFREQERLVKAVIIMLKEQAQEVRNTAKLAILTLKNNLSNGREFDQLLLRCNLTDQQMEQARKVVEQEDYDSLSNLNVTKYGGSMRGSSMDSRGINQRMTPYAPPRQNISGSDGFQNAQILLDSKMQSTFLSGGAVPQNQHPGASNGFGMTGSSLQAFKKRQPSVSKPVDPKLMEDFKELINSCNTNDWNQRLKAIDQLNNWISQHSITVKQTQASKFIQLVDIYCKLIQDNNAKVQTKAILNFRSFLINENLKQLIEQNLTLIVEAISHNLASTSPSIRTQSDQLLQLLEECVENPTHLVQPMVAQINLSNNRSKPQLIERLSQLILKVDQQSVIDRYVVPLLKPNNKVHSEAMVNPKLREALSSLEIAVKHG